MDDVSSLTRQLDRDYQLGEILGGGGMGVVYSAVQRSLGRRVAIKVPHPELATDPAVSRRFRSEARASGQLDHRNIARVIDLGGHDGALYLVMQHVPGTALDKLVMQHGPMEPRIAADLCDQILAALGEAHTAGIIHADIKTANVLVETLGDNTLHAVVIDFGLARFYNETSFDDGLLLSGTPDYLAPELIRGGPPTVASDIYAAGIVLYELLTGTTPFGGGTSAEILDRQLDDAVVLPSLRCPDHDIPSALETIVMRALAKDPDARFATTAQFALALRAATPIVLLAPRQRVARGTQGTGFSAETTTRNWQREQMPLPRTVTAARNETTRIQQIRIVVREALAGGDGDAIVTSYLELVRALIDGRRLAEAAAELERGIATLRPDVASKAIPAAIWRLQLCLAALYSGLGNPARARGAAMIGQEDALRAASSVGEDRARELLVRLARSGKSHSGA